MSTELQKIVKLLLCIAIGAAQTIVQEETIEVAGLGVEKYVKVASKINVELLVPGYEYEVPLTISWNIPDAALAQIKNPRIDVFIELESQNITFTYFKRNKTISNVHRTILQCYVTNGTCGNLSKLTEEILFYVKVPHLGAKLSEYIIVRASPLPFGEFSEIVEEQASLSNELMDLKQSITTNATNVNATLFLNETQQKEIEQKINEAETKISQFKLNEAKQDIDELKKLLKEIGIQYTFITKISYLENAANELFLANLTQNEMEMRNEIIALLTKAKEHALSFDFTSANKSIADAELKLLDLKTSISERQKIKIDEPAFLKIPFTFDVFAAVLAIIVIFLLFLIFKFTRKEGRK